MESEELEVERCEDRRRADPEVARTLDELHQAQASHPFWDNRLFRACHEGALGLEDLRLLFSQYFLYSQNFTRYLAGLMANCEDDLYRARISENLWEEGGGTEPQKRHAELFRDFLRRGLGVADLGAIEYADFTRYFVREYTAFCIRSEPAATSAFLSLGTEGIVKRMYQIFVKSLARAGVAEEHLVFFRIHIDCDDGHARTLEDMMVSYAQTPGWRESCLRAMDHALSLRARFFENLFEAIQLRRVRTLVARIQERTSLASTTSPFKARCESDGARLYENVHEKLEIEFEVTRLPFVPEVLDPRVVKIAPHRSNELHRHAHETVFYVIAGTGVVVIDTTEVEVRPGDAVFVPRWAFHQTRNRGDTEMLILAVTDFGLTGRAFVGNYDKTARMNPGPQGAVPVRGEEWLGEPRHR